MLIESEHRIKFEVTDDSEIELPDITAPLFEYKIGDEIRFYDTFTDDDVEVYDLIVTDTKNEINFGLTPEQVLIVYVEKKSDDKAT